MLKNIYGTNIHAYALHQVVVSDSGKVLTPVKNCLERARESEAGWRHTISADNDYTFPPPLLTPAEIRKVTDHSGLAQEYYEATVEFHKVATKGSSLGAQLQRLSTLLKRGGFHGGQDGEDLDSGKAANEGIFAFNQFWEQFSKAQQQKFYDDYEGLEGVIGRLIRPKDVNYKDERYCVELLAGALDTILEREKSTIFSTVGDFVSYDYLAQNVTEKWQLFVAEIAKPDYTPLPSTTRGKKFLAVTLGLPVEAQQAMFKAEGFPNALFYAMANEPAAVPFLCETLSLLEEPAKSVLMATKNSQGMTALIVAAQKGYLDVVTALSNAGADLNAIDSDGDTGLAWAVYNGYTEVATLLLARMSAIGVRNNEGKNVLDIAIDKHPGMVSSLLLKIVTLEPGQQQEIFKRSPYPYPNVLHYVIAHRPTLLPQLLEVLKSDDILRAALLGARDVNGVTALIAAAKNGNLDVVKALIAAGAADENNSSALISAVKYGHVEIAKLLLVHNTSVDLIDRDGNGDNILELARKLKLSYSSYTMYRMFGPLLLRIMILEVDQQRRIFNNNSRF